MIPVNEPLLGQLEKELLSNCIDTGWISSEGPFVKEFEQRIAKRVGRAHGIAVANGSAALDIAVAALGLGPGDEVIVPTFTIISCASAVVRSGATPVFVDADPDTWNMATDAIADKITPRTQAIMVVHIYGLPVDMDAVRGLAETHGLKIIEDAAEALGQKYRDQPCGSFGEVSTFSFYANKNITTGEGGMVVTDDPEIAQRCRSLRNLCFSPRRRFVHETLGWNYRMTNIQAALGVAQMEQLDAVMDRKRRIGQRYQSLLQDVPGIQRPIDKLDYAENAYWVYGLVLDRTFPLDAAQFMDRLKERGIGTRPFFWSMHEQPVFRKENWFVHERLPESEHLARRGFYLPGGAGLTDDQIRQICRAVTEEVTHAI